MSGPNHLRLFLKPKPLSACTLSTSGEFPSYIPGDAYEGRIQIDGAFGDVRILEVTSTGDELPPGYEITVDNENQEIVLTWPAYEVNSDVWREIPNADFEEVIIVAGSIPWPKYWQLSHGLRAGSESPRSGETAIEYQGNYYGEVLAQANASLPVVLAQTVNAQFYLKHAGGVRGKVRITWFDESGGYLGDSYGEAMGEDSNGEYVPVTITAVAPANGTAVPGFVFDRFEDHNKAFLDDFSWDVTYLDEDGTVGVDDPTLEFNLDILLEDAKGCRYLSQNNAIVFVPVLPSFSPGYFEYGIGAQYDIQWADFLGTFLMAQNDDGNNSDGLWYTKDGDYFSYNDEDNIAGAQTSLTIGPDRALTTHISASEIQYTLDGMTWNTVAMGASSVNGGSCFNGTYYFVWEGSTIRRSLDCVTWEFATSPAIGGTGASITRLISQAGNSGGRNLIAFTTSSLGKNIFRSEDNGASWIAASFNGSHPPHTRPWEGAAADELGTVIGYRFDQTSGSPVAGTLTMYKSTNGGASFDIIDHAVAAGPAGGYRGRRLKYSNYLWYGIGDNTSSLSEESYAWVSLNGEPPFTAVPIPTLSDTQRPTVIGYNGGNMIVSLRKTSLTGSVITLYDATADEGNPVSYLKFETAVGSTNILDESGRIWTAYGDAKVALFGSARTGGGFYGTILTPGGDYMTTPDSEDLRFGTGNFKISFGIRYGSFVDGATLAEKGYTNGGSTGWAIKMKVDGQLQFCSTNGGLTTIIEETGEVMDINPKEYFIEIERVGDEITIRRNGRLTGSAISGFDFSDSTGVLSLGGGSSTGFDGNWLHAIIRRFRIDR